MGVNYQTDNTDSIYSEFVALENEIDKVGRNMKGLAQRAETASADYELAKNRSLILMYAEEAGNAEADVKPFKRTEAHREAIYRTEHAHLRLLRGITRSELDSERDLLKALLAKLGGTQSRKTLIMVDRERQTGHGA